MPFAHVLILKENLGTQKKVTNDNKGIGPFILASSEMNRRQ